jgi:hypothetical protein
MGSIGTIATITPLRITIIITCITIAAEPAETAKRNRPAQAGLFCGTNVGQFRRGRAHHAEIGRVKRKYHSFWFSAKLGPV